MVLNDNKRNLKPERFSTYHHDKKVKTPYQNGICLNNQLGIKKSLESITVD